ncbi:hypothetical protein Sjap_016814 [Stephania japonica]|uniref:Phototropic-responsive NPH3 family protein n=1 Tax=Stephania japonica TaxID=461633 RepID=A0AAP0I4Z8_9MAGN
MASEKSTSKGQAWFCTTGLPSDIVIEVNDMSFHLHKFPLTSKSKKLHQLIAEQESTKSQSEIEKHRNDDDEDEEEEEEEEEERVPESVHITLPEFPGGSETFESAAKFCYGVKIEISSTNVAPLRCAAEYLEMTEEYSEGDNLINKTEKFLSESVLKNIKDSIKTLRSCESLMPLAEALSIPQRCIDSIASRASSTDPSLFGWPMSEAVGAGAGATASASNQMLWNGIDAGVPRKNSNLIATKSTSESWIEDLALLSLPLYKQIISSMKDKNLNSEIIERSLISYARKSIPGLSRSSRKHSSGSVASEAEQRELIETIITNLPLEKSSRRPSRTRPRPTSSSTIRHLFGLLRTANILNASEACRASLEKKIASQLDHATLDDLLIPSYSYLIETLYDVDCVQRILQCFLQGLDQRLAMEEDVDGADESPAVNPVMLVGKLIDGYLSEIASDANLKPEKFIELAVALPDQARLYDDGLYRAVDVYLKAHPWVTEEERERICGVMDCQKLTLEACTHAAQNERLPLRAVVQVLFFEQLQLRHAIAGSLLSTAPPPPLAAPTQLEEQLDDDDDDDDEHEHEIGNGTNGVVRWRAAVRENQVLRLDMDSMRSRVQELERECTSMRKAIEKIDRVGPQSEHVHSQSGSGWRTSLTKKFGCKFKTQVCDSHERTVVEANRKVTSSTTSRHHRQTSRS